ncbi:NUDIX hydrolase [Aliiglaciecola sp. CAU 1673]|uniref:NUDIX hydrolase n=1 Tax=Aliiglaciecola sp. CAU 1673 TaxID=3032595 RepID=UPI0023DB8750|nr:NUDIX hydrolase [Aliiglaciecola sp. CAU 1673]MDF2177720.1 NUDIX hydrolase [Aliiglaciecola sp. CAU 1673]
MFKPNMTVACVVEAQGKFLLVEEKINGKHVLNQPAGHLEANESLLEAAHRELYEETGLFLSPQSIVGLYQYPSMDEELTFLRLCFAISLQKPVATAPKDADILACHWLSPGEISQSGFQLRSPMVEQCIQDYLAGASFPLTLYRQVISNG